eukprot:NODE_61_length_26588_cov_1.146778.p4 type:complete len:452 gc:universal NODE_61_length_26588_cov_1.146778:11700-10345(-)
MKRGVASLICKIFKILIFFANLTFWTTTRIIRLLSNECAISAHKATEFHASFSIKHFIFYTDWLPSTKIYYILTCENEKLEHSTLLKKHSDCISKDQVCQWRLHTNKHIQVCQWRLHTNKHIQVCQWRLHTNKHIQFAHMSIALALYKLLQGLSDMSSQLKGSLKAFQSGSRDAQKIADLDNIIKDTSRGHLLTIIKLTKHLTPNHTLSCPAVAQGTTAAIGSQKYAQHIEFWCSHDYFMDRKPLQFNRELTIPKFCLRAEKMDTVALRNHITAPMKHLQSGIYKEYLELIKSYCEQIEENDANLPCYLVSDPNYFHITLDLQATNFSTFSVKHVNSPNPNTDIYDLDMPAIQSIIHSNYKLTHAYHLNVFFGPISALKSAKTVRNYCLNHQVCEFIHLAEDLDVRYKCVFIALIASPSRLVNSNAYVSEQGFNRCNATQLDYYFKSVVPK